jgi:hypothetical protein
MLYALYREPDLGSGVRGFLSSYEKEEMSVAELCRVWNLPPTGYWWINRYNETGQEGLVDRSRRSHSCCTASSLSLAPDTIIPPPVTPLLDWFLGGVFTLSSTLSRWWQILTCLKGRFSCTATSGRLI